MCFYEGRKTCPYMCASSFVKVSQTPPLSKVIRVLVGIWQESDSTPVCHVAKTTWKRETGSIKLPYHLRVSPKSHVVGRVANKCQWISYLTCQEPMKWEYTKIEAKCLLCHCACRRSKQRLAWTIHMQVFDANHQSSPLDRVIIESVWLAFNPKWESCSNGPVAARNTDSNISNRLVVSLWCSRIVFSASPALLEVPLAESSKALLLRNGIDICSNEKRDNVEEWYPCMLRQEFLRESKCNRRSDPADLHHRHETCFPSCMNLMNGFCAGDDGHRHKVDTVLDGSNLSFCQIDLHLLERIGLTIKLLTIIWRILAFKLVRPANNFCSMLIRTCPNGALMKAPYAAIFGTLDVK